VERERSGKRSGAERAENRVQISGAGGAENDGAREEHGAGGGETRSGNGNE